MSTDNFDSRFKSWKNQYIDLVADNSDYIISINSRELSKETSSEFRRRCAAHPALICEVGSGSGGHLVAQAVKNPAALHVGFELRFKRAHLTAKKAAQAELKNVLLVRGDARFLPELVAPETLQGIYINFPDPWDKRRWRKNRILSSEFVANLHRLLLPNGFISHKSDHQGYFAETKQLIETHSGFKITKYTENLYSSPHCSENIASEFENLFRSQGVPIGYLEARKIGGDSIPAV